jgi:hypothetical protein
MPPHAGLPDRLVGDSAAYVAGLLGLWALPYLGDVLASAGPLILIGGFFQDQFVIQLPCGIVVPGVVATTNSAIIASWERREGVVLVAIDPQSFRCRVPEPGTMIWVSHQSTRRYRPRPLPWHSD